MFDPGFWETWSKYWVKIIEPAIWVTIRLLLASMFFALIIGFLLSIFLILYHPTKGLHPRPKIYKVMSFVVNTVRSFPFIILIVAISPLTRAIMGTIVGERAAVLPLTIGASPFVARIFENSFLEVDTQVIEAARSFGASDLQVIFKVMLKEAVPSMTSGVTLSAVNFLTATTMAGAVGAGGIGSVALSYGFYSFNNSVLYTCVIILLLMVQVIQCIGNWLYKKNTK